MPEQVPFINRESELALIDKLMIEEGTLRIVCLYADGGIGKTRFLQEIRHHYLRQPRERVLVTDIVDFDDRSLHVSENVGVKIAHFIDRKTFPEGELKEDGYSNQWALKLFKENNLRVENVVYEISNDNILTCKEHPKRLIDVYKYDKE